MPNPHPNADDASLYVLDLLDPEAKKAFEVELDGSPDLRRHVTDLEANLEALAEAMPPVPPPARVWAAIADRTAQAECHQAPPALTVVWSWVCQWFTNGWAVAALVTAAFVTHLLLDPPVGSMGSLASAEGANAGGRGRAGEGREAGRGGAGLEGRPAPSMRPSGSSQRPGSLASGAASASRREQEEARLQDRVRSLSEQVTMLTRMLTQQTVLPAGASRLQVFRLVGTNVAGDNLDVLNPDPRRGLASNPVGGSGGAGTAIDRPSGNGSATGVGVADPSGVATGSGTGGVEASNPDVALALALAAARQLAAIQGSMEDAGGSSFVKTQDPLDAVSSGFAPPSVAVPSETVVAPGEVASGRESIRVIDLAQSEATTAGGGVGAGLVGRSAVGLAPSSDGSAFGAFSPDTGQGAVAFRVPTSVGGEGVLQLWVSDAQTGLMQSLGMTTLSATVPVPQVMVMRFNMSGSAFTTPTFMITREPAGGSAVPTGPVVALPPSATPVPNP